ncbi:MAG: hypothetical protein FJ060_05815 [Cyanobacteria bacterium K_Offshore_0m_m2_072]|nr:hypothetical protein [Cyanobacteria bacterium K_Offshore_0m_m2_072]
MTPSAVGRIPPAACPWKRWWRWRRRQRRAPPKNASPWAWRCITPPITAGSIRQTWWRWRRRCGKSHKSTPLGVQQICSTVSWQLAQRLQERADYEGRSVSNLMAHLLEVATA